MCNRRASGAIVSARELVLLEKNIAAADDSATGWQFSQAFATVIVTHASPRCSLANTVDELSARGSRIGHFARFAARAWWLVWDAMGQHWPACIAACVSPVHGAHTCLHWQVAQHAPAGQPARCHCRRQYRGNRCWSQTPDSPPARSEGWRACSADSQSAGFPAHPR